MHKPFVYSRWFLQLFSGCHAMTRDTKSQETIVLKDSSTQQHPTYYYINSEFNSSHVHISPKVFSAQLCNKGTILHEGTIYPSS